MGDNCGMNRKTTKLRSISAYGVRMLPCAVLALAACKAPPPPAPAAAPVAVAGVGRKTMPDLLAAVGTVEAINSVAVKSLVDGQLLESEVKDGDAVTAGQLLFRIDPRPAQAALAQAHASLAKDEAARDLARAQVDRYKPIAAKGFISADQMQQTLTTWEAALASVKVDQANVAAAKLTLGYTDIHAPLAGRVGRILVQPGNLVKANDVKPLLVINQLSPIFVSFAVPGAYVERVRAAQVKGVLHVRAQGDALKTAQDGELAFVDNAIDPATNTVKLRAQFGNSGEALWPGQFVNIALNLGSDANAVVVPDAAVKAGPNGSYVFIVKPDQHAELRIVTTVRTVAGETLIGRGLDGGETVIVDGQSRVVDGAPVKVVDANATAPTK